MKTDPARTGHEEALWGSSLAIWAVSMGVLWVLSLMPGFSTWQRGVFGAPLLTTTLAFVGVPLAWSASSKRPSARLPQTSRAWKRALKTGGISLAVLGPATGLGFPLVASTGATPYSLRGGVVLAAVMGVAVLGILWLTRRLPGAVRGDYGYAPARLIALLTASGFAAAALHTSFPKAAALLHVFVFIGLAEELLFRGVIQERMAQGAEAARTRLGEALGPGVLPAAALFGASHFLSPTGPFQLGWALWTFMGGLAFGVVCHRGGSFVASALAHGVIMAVPVVLGAGP